MTRNYGSGVSDVAERLKPLLGEAIAQEAIEHLKGDFLDPNGLGPRRVAEFLYEEPRADVQTEVVGFVRRLLDECGP